MSKKNQVYDCCVIGGGPAGLSAAIYLGRYLRSALVIDRGDGRWNTHEINENYLGFPKSISSRELREKGVEQAKKYGAEIINDNVTVIKKEKDIFNLKGNKNIYSSKTIILATGVTDLFPHFNGWRDYLGRTLFWCITCDGYKAKGKKVMIVGNHDEAAETAMQFLNFTKKITFVTNALPGKLNISSKTKDRFKKAKIPIFEGLIKKVYGSEGRFSKLILNDGKKIELDFMFNQQGSVPNSQLAKPLGVAMDKAGYIVTDHEQRTNLTKFYAAGDVTKLYAHQIVTAAHEGATAGITANYDLYNPDQRES